MAATLLHHVHLAQTMGAQAPVHHGQSVLVPLTVFILSIFVGIEVISRVPSLLHTPLMSGSNAIHGVILVGTMVVLGESHGTLEVTIGFFAVLLATLNVVGGFVVTDRMLGMFKSSPQKKADKSEVAK